MIFWKDRFFWSNDARIMETDFSNICVWNDWQSIYAAITSRVLQHHSKAELLLFSSLNHLSVLPISDVMYTHNIHVCTCIYTCIYVIHICTCIFIHISISIYVHICTYVCVYTYIYYIYITCMYVFVYIFVRLCVYVQICIRIYMYVCMCIYICDPYTQTLLSAHAHTIFIYMNVQTIDEFENISKVLTDDAFLFTGM